MMLTAGSLFSGVGGLDLGFERAGFTILWQCEIEPYAQRVLRKQWPHVMLFEDIRDLIAPPMVDVLIGGFPCQDISVAGKGAGIHGERSGLWGEYARIIRTVRPRYVIVENVPGLLAAKKACCGKDKQPSAIARVLGELSESGYDAEWQVLSAAQFGAPHLRRRVFIVAYSNGVRAQVQIKGQYTTEQIVGGDGAYKSLAYTNGTVLAQRQVFGDHAEQELASFVRGGDYGGDIQDAHSQRLEGAELQWGEVNQCQRVSDPGWWATEPDVGRVVDGSATRLDGRKRVSRLKCLGNAVVPQVAEWVALQVMQHARR